MSTPPVFKWRPNQAEIIILSVRWYCRYALSNRDLEDQDALNKEYLVDRSTINRARVEVCALIWADEFARCCTLLMIRGGWMKPAFSSNKECSYLYRAVNLVGNANSSTDRRGVEVASPFLLWTCF